MDSGYKYRTHVGAKDIYKYYCKKTGNPMKLTRGQFTNLFKEIINHFMDLMIHKNFHLKLPRRLGTVCIIEYTIQLKEYDGKLVKRGLAPDWSKCHILWEKLYGKMSLKEWGKINNKPIVYFKTKRRCKFLWDKRICNISNTRRYSIHHLKHHKQELVHSIIEDDNLKFNNNN